MKQSVPHPHWPYHWEGVYRDELFTVAPGDAVGRFARVCGDAADEPRAGVAGAFPLSMRSERAEPPASTHVQRSPSIKWYPVQ